MKYVVAATIGTLTGIVIYLVFLSVVQAHEAPKGWNYDVGCCSGIDCRPAKVKETPNGYVVPTGEIVPYGSPKIHESKDGDFHWCSVGGSDTGKTICLYVPPRGY